MSTATLTQEPVKRITPRQRTAIMLRFRDLGLTHPTWRDDRLAMMSIIIGRPGVSSVNDLSFGEAGYLLGVLRECHDCRYLAAIVADHAMEDAA